MSSRRTRLVLVAAAAAATGTGLVTHGDGAQAAPAAKRLKLKKVLMFDNYYSPAKLTVKVGQRVQWVWPSDVGDTHDVKVKKGPKGAKKFTSPHFATGAKWPRPKADQAKLFRKPGKYQLYCTYHETEMTMTVTVKK